ncbi:MAG: low molecular weight phosphatase family protein [Opitutaceae bacterium]|nr:low molecular weight phosphatase family protein [Opitutaceae bacterium]
MRQVLFICSGNFYRSRFAEAVFNHHATLRHLPVRAFSRGLATHLVHGEGEISLYTRFALAARGIALHHTGTHPVQLARGDLERAHRSIAVKEAEHRPLMQQLFPDWENRIEYWAVHDLDAAAPDVSIPLLEQRVIAVLDACVADLSAHPTSDPHAVAASRP